MALTVSNAWIAHILKKTTSINPSDQAQKYGKAT